MIDRIFFRHVSSVGRELGVREGSAPTPKVLYGTTGKQHKKEKLSRVAGAYFKPDKEPEPNVAFLSSTIDLHELEIVVYHHFLVKQVTGPHSILFLCHV